MRTTLVGGWMKRRPRELTLSDGEVMYGAEKSAGVNIRSSCASLPHRPQGTNLDCLCPTDTRLITEEKYDI